MKTIESYLRGAIIAGIFAIPFLAFIVGNSLFFPFITGKNFGFRIIVEVIFALWILLAYANAAYRPKFSWIMAATAFFVAVVFVADITGVNPAKSLWSNYERMEGFVALIHIFAYFVVAGSVLTKELWINFLQTSVFAGVIMSFYGLFQLSGGAEISQGGIRLDGRFGNAAYFGGYLLFNVFLTMFLMARTKKYDFLWWTYALAVILQTVIMFLTETRGSMLGFFVGIILAALLFIFLSKKNPVMKRIAVGIIAFVAVFIFLVFQNKEADFVKSNRPLARLASISFNETTVASRFMVWEMAIRGFEERPILGWGQDNFNFVFNKYYNPRMHDQEQWFDRAHDIFLDWLIAAGFFGLFSYLLLFVLGVLFVWKPEMGCLEKGWWANLRHVWKRYLSGEEENGILEKSILTGLFAAYFVHNIFVFDNLFSYILFFSVLAFLHGSGSREFFPSNVPAKKAAASDELPVTYVAIPVFAVLAVVMYVVNIKPILANQALIDAISPHPNAAGQMTFTQKNLDSFKEVISYDTFGNSEAREQLVQTAIRAKSVDGLDETLKQGLFAFAKEQTLRQVKEAPGDARNETFAGMLFFRYDEEGEAIVHFEEAHRLSPQKQTIGFNLILAYLNNNQGDKAFALAREMYDLAPEFTDAGKTYAMTAIYKGDQALADDILIKTFGTTIPYNEDIINTYVFAKRFDRIILILEEKLKEGEDPKLRIRLAATYLEAGDKTRAIAEVQKVMDTNPQFKQQGEYYIQEIRAGKRP
ncbi:MAG: O-antigen ligase family protein [Candidatus Paceibacterota bacterium]|jgi:O-antigen ligase/tetratricopeptide (TPR) repeat protein